MSESRKTIFVTGAGGYVASHCIVTLLQENFNIIGIDNFQNCVKGTNDFPVSLERVQKLTGKKITFYYADLCQVHSLRMIFENHRIDAIIHFAALKAVGQSSIYPLKYYGNNVVGSYNLIKTMKEYNVKKIVFSSSATVYGDPTYLPLDENHPTGQCTNPYGKTKFFIEEILKDVCAANKDWSCYLLRYFNPVGAHPSGEIGEDSTDTPNNLMPYIAHVAVGRIKKLSVYGFDYDTPDGTGVRDYIHIMDVADGHTITIKHMFEHDIIGLKIYNLGTGLGNSVLDVIKAFEKASGTSISYELCPRRAGDISTSYATCDLIYKELGWKANFIIDDMCKDMWNWQSKNPNGYLEKKKI